MTTAGSVAGSRRRAAATPTNLIVNGDFSAADAGWGGFYYSGKAPTGGKAVFTAAPAYDGIFQTALPLVAGSYYELKFTISARSSGNLFGQFYGGTNRNGTIRTANGVFTERLLANAGNNAFQLQMETGGTLSVDDVSLIGPYTTATVGGA